MREAYIYDSVKKTAYRANRFVLREVKPIDLLATLFKALHKRNGRFDTSKVDDVVLGCVTPIGEQGGDIAKFALMYVLAGICTLGMQINRFCPSGLESLTLAAMKIRSGWEELVVAVVALKA